jgi:hypothetical protein
MKTRDKVELKDRLTYDREEFAAITGTSADMVSQWIHDGMTGCRRSAPSASTSLKKNPPWNG